jgi:hypothetical protein
MSRSRLFVLGLLLALLLPTGSTTQLSSATATTAAPRVSGCQVFPSNNFWNRDISGLLRHARSAQWLSHMSTGRTLHPDFGPSYGDGPDYGIPITVVGSTHPKVTPTFEYADESSSGGYPFGGDTRIEGGRDSGGDMHAVVVDSDACRLYETWSTREANGRWTAGSGALWSLKSNTLRPDSWTSADAAGLPILPGLLRWSEVKAGQVSHAIRFTTDVTSRRHIWPARHDAGSQDSLAYPPMGARFRLKSSFSTTGYGAYARTVILAMKRYGLVLADNGSPWFFQGAQNAAWPPALIEDLKRIPASAFVAVDTAPLRVNNSSAATR